MYRKRRIVDTVKNFRNKPKNNEKEKILDKNGLISVAPKFIPIKVREMSEMFNKNKVINRGLL